MIFITSKQLPVYEDLTPDGHDRKDYFSISNSSVRLCHYNTFLLLANIYLLMKGVHTCSVSLGRNNLSLFITPTASVSLCCQVHNFYAAKTTRNNSALLQ